MTIRYDTFTGDGNLDGHVSDGGLGTWGNGPDPYDIDLSISGGSVVIPSGVHMFDVYANAIASGIAFNPGVVELYFDIQWSSLVAGPPATPTLGFGLLSAAGGLGAYCGYMEYHSAAPAHWAFFLTYAGGAYGTEVTVPYADMPIDVTPMRVGIEYGASGTVRVFTEPLGGGTRTYRGTSTYVPMAVPTTLRPYLSVLEVGIIAVAGSCDNYTVTDADVVLAAAPSSVSISLTQVVIT